MGFVNSRGVHKDDLAFRTGEDSSQSPSGRLCHGGGDGYLLSDEAIQERGFAHVGAPDQRHEP